MAAIEDSSDNHYSEKGDDSIELYADWPQYEKLLKEQLDSAGAQPPPEREAVEVRILMPGRRNSKLSENLYDAGFKNITYLDMSEDFIRDVLRRNVRVRPGIMWRTTDITDIKFANETFDAIVDKGVLDSLMMPTSSSLGRPYLNEVKRVLKAGGKYVCLTLAASHVFSNLLLPMFRFGWKMSLYTIGQEGSIRDPIAQTFMVVAKKDSSPAVYAISSFVEESNSPLARVLSEVLLRENRIRSEYADGTDILYSLEDLHLGAIGKLSKLVPGRRVKLSIGGPKSFTYNSVLLDAKEDSGPFTYPYTVSIVPQSQAHKWIYTSEEGQWVNVKDSKASRLLMIFLESSNSNIPMDDIKKDLIPLVKHLEPEDCGKGYQIPFFIAVQKTEKLEIMYQDSSDMTGPIVVKDLIYQDDLMVDDYKGCTFRHLIFNRTRGVVQSQALLSIKESNRISTDVGKDKEQQASNPKNEGKQRKSDFQSSRSPVSSGEVKVVRNHLVSQYHNGVVFGIRLISSYLKVSTSARGLVNTVVIGLGGGLLPMYMKNYLPSLKIEVVEIDSKILHVAREYFGFSADESLKVHISDGIRFVKEKADENNSCKVDILVVDVPSSDMSSTLSCPAADFVDESFLWTVKESLSEQGLFIINVITGSSTERNAVNSRLKKVFSCVLSLQIRENINEVLFAFKTTASPIKEDQLSESCNEFAKSLEHEKKWIEEEVGLSKSIKLLK